MISPKAQQQTGTALLLALLIMTLASLLTLNIQQRLALDLARSASITASLRASEYVAGLEALAGKALRQDHEQEAELDSYASPWAQELPAMPIPGGVVSGKLESLDGRFNLNSLIDSNGVDDDAARLRLERLLSALALPPMLADRIHDWIDADSIPRPQGGEDQLYLSQQTPYLSANQTLADISELRLIAGIDGETFKTLRPHVSALPVHHRRINVNLASIPVLMSISPAITEQLARELHQQGRAVYRSISDFSNAPALQGIDISAQVPALAVTSNYFKARMLVVQDNLPRRYEALLQRSGSHYAVLWRHATLP